MLFDLLDAMDGAAADADLLFVLTTNRADLLGPALAARPGRVDVAIEIDLPDAEARERLLVLYARSVPLRLSEAETREIVERTDGVTASFLKELLRRAISSLCTTPPRSRRSPQYTSRALDDLLDSGQQLTRSLLGVGKDRQALAPGGGPGPLPASRGEQPAEIAHVRGVAPDGDEVAHQDDQAAAQRSGVGHAHLAAMTASPASLRVAASRLRRPPLGAHAPRALDPTLNRLR